MGNGRLIALMTGLCLLIPAAASANGAMSLALATFAWMPWLVYVTVTVLFEAAVMGRWMGIQFARALIYSLKANFVTAVIGGFFSGIISYMFLGMFGSTLNPNPFAQTLVVFTLFGIGSACIEYRFWIRQAAPLPHDIPLQTSLRMRSGQAFKRCLMVHLIGVPLGLMVLLMPSRPYTGLEMQVHAKRVTWLELPLRRALDIYIAERQAIPDVRNYEELLTLLKPNLDQLPADPGFWAAAYVPDYSRFDTGEMRRNPIEWNTAVSGKKLDDLSGTVWLIRSRYHGFTEGLVWNGQVERNTDAQKLGYR